MELQKKKELGKKMGLARLLFWLVAVRWPTAHNQPTIKLNSAPLLQRCFRNSLSFLLSSFPAAGPRRGKEVEEKKRTNQSLSINSFFSLRFFEKRELMKSD